MKKVNSYSSFPAGSPWAGVMFAQWPTRILGPNGVQFSPGGNPSLIGFVSASGVIPPLVSSWIPRFKRRGITGKHPTV